MELDGFLNPFFPRKEVYMEQLQHMATLLAEMEIQAWKLDPTLARRISAALSSTRCLMTQLDYRELQTRTEQNGRQ